jgi:membrane-associated phospholipid phosphatase
LNNYRAQIRAQLFPGWRVIAGLLIFAVCTFILAELSERLDHGPISVADVQLSNWLHANGSRPLTILMIVLTSLGSTLLVSCVATGLSVFLLVRRRYFWLAVTATTVFGGMLLNRSLKFVFHRTRPHFDDPIMIFTDYSFPSGHTMAATVLYGVIAAYLISRTTDVRKRSAAIAAAASLIVLVAFSRIYLGAHYLTDVLGAIAEGLAWLSLCLTIFHYLRKR